MVNKRGLVLYKTKHKQVGKRHDYKICKKNHPDTPKEVESILDLGFLGVEGLSRSKISIAYQEEEKESRFNSRKKSITKVILEKELW